MNKINSIPHLPASNALSPVGNEAPCTEKGSPGDPSTEAAAGGALTRFCQHRWELRHQQRQEDEHKEGEDNKQEEEDDEENEEDEEEDVKGEEDKENKEDNGKDE